MKSLLLSSARECTSVHIGRTGMTKKRKATNTSGTPQESHLPAGGERDLIIPAEGFSTFRKKPSLESATRHSSFLSLPFCFCCLDFLPLRLFSSWRSSVGTWVLDFFVINLFALYLSKEDDVVDYLVRFSVFCLW